MSRAIIINKCHECPNYGRYYADIPRCKLARRELPHEVVDRFGTVTTSSTGEIPDWCPLEDIKI